LSQRLGWQPLIRTCFIGFPTARCLPRRTRWRRERCSMRLRSAAGAHGCVRVSQLISNDCQRYLPRCQPTQRWGVCL
jgi:hypothetical protein